jgi:hypothetical protein
MACNGFFKSGTGEAMPLQIKDAPEILTDPELIANRGRSLTGIRVMIETSVIDAHNAIHLVEQIVGRVDIQACESWILDFQHVQFMDSAGATAIAKLIRSSTGRKCIELAAVQDQIKNRWPELFVLNASAP